MPPNPNSNPSPGEVQRREDRIVELVKMGLTQRQVAERIGMSQGGVARYVKAARHKGRLPLYDGKAPRGGLRRR